MFSSAFQIFSADEIESYRLNGAILRACLEKVAASVRPGMHTRELDRIAREFICSHAGAKPAFLGYRGYPATLCTSVNEEPVHGIPGARVLEEGDIVSIDCGVIMDHLYTDACITVGVGKIDAKNQSLLDTTSRALEAACAKVKAGTRVGDISSTVQHIVEKAGYKCIPSLTGHGLGRSLHMFPDIPNIGRAGTGPVLPANCVIAIEPITSMGSSDIVETDDGWTLKTRDGSRSAHFEHTVLVLEDGYEILA